MSTRREFVGTLTSAAAAGALFAGTTLTVDGCNIGDWIQVAIKDLPTIVSIVTTVATIVADAATGGAAAPAVAAVIKVASTAAQVALATVQQLVKDYQANPSASTLDKIKTSLLDVQSNLGQILDASHVFNGSLRAIVTTGLGLGITVLTQILSLIPAAPKALTKTQATQLSRTAMKPLSSSDLVSHFNAFADAHGYSKYSIQ